MLLTIAWLDALNVNQCQQMIPKCSKVEQLRETLEELQLGAHKNQILNSNHAPPGGTNHLKVKVGTSPARLHPKRSIFSWNCLTTIFLFPAPHWNVRPFFKHFCGKRHCWLFTADGFPREWHKRFHLKCRPHIRRATHRLSPCLTLSEGDRGRRCRVTRTPSSGQPPLPRFLRPAPPTSQPDL